jgi:ABC-type lipoprotein export system ATPase subunit
MALQKLTIENFTAFKKAQIEFSPGINVVIGANSTGKSHLMKLGYVLHRALESGQVADLGLRLEGVFRPDAVGRLVRRGRGARKAKVEASFDEGSVGFELSGSGPPVKGTMRESRPLPRAVFLPSRELLAMQEGFIQAYENRELSFDETYFDGCLALSGVALRGPRGEKASKLAEPIFQALGGRVVLEGKRFYVALPEGNLEAHLLSEGMRKIASLGHLIVNGSLTKSGLLFWDEPEANLNPMLVTKVVEFLLALARSGVQVVLATHDHLLTSRLSLAAEYPEGRRVPIAFHALRPGRDGIVCETAGLLHELEHNPILEEFARFYDDEQERAAAAIGGGVRA